MHFAQVLVIAVGTPQGSDGAADIRQVLAVADVIALHAGECKTVLCKSTVPVGTCDQLQEKLAETKYAISVVSNPEFLKQGDAVNDCMKPQPASS